MAANWLEESVINHFFRQQNVTPTTVYLALYVSDPTDSDTGTEVNGQGYARQAIALTAPTQIGGKAVTQNTAKVEFPTAGGSWGTVSHVGIRTAAIGGNLLVSMPLTIAKTVNTGDQIAFNSGNLTFTVD